MAFIGIALLIAAGLAFAISADAGALFGLNRTQTGQIVPLVLILILLAGGAFSKRQRLGQFVTGLLLWTGIFGLAVVGYAYRTEIGSIANRVTAELSPGVAVVSEDGASATFRRGLGGSFRLMADINGVSVPMIFDTGASAVVLTPEDAARAGIDTGGKQFSVPVQTANGVGRAAEVSLAEIGVGGIERRNIRAFVAAPGAMETSLLGMSFLQTLSGFSVSNDALELRD